jgi:hypothetical protein
MSFWMFTGFFFERIAVPEYPFRSAEFGNMPPRGPGGARGRDRDRDLARMMAIVIDNGYFSLG